MCRLEDGVVHVAIHPNLDELRDVRAKHCERPVDGDVGNALLPCSPAGLREEDGVRTPLVAGLAQAVAHDDLDAFGVEVVVAVDGVHLDATGQTLADGGDEVIDSVQIVGNNQYVNRLIGQSVSPKLEL